jgi:predicted DNA-binding transcriptional regulator AlpA
MKNHNEKLIPTRKYNASPRLTHEFKRKLEKQVRLSFINHDFIKLIKATIEKLPAKDWIACLHYFLKLANQTQRRPDSDWLKANEDLYLEKMSDLQDEQAHFEPIKWISSEIEYLNNTAERLTVEDVNERLDIMLVAKERLSKPWLTKDEVMELFGISESTLSRWMYDDQMPCRKRGKFTYWYKDEIDEWMKKEVA